ncbi:MAG: MinD/ParA family ATP-binding protein, partial [Polyangiales bacterium]
MQPSVPPPSWVHGESLPPSIDLPPTGKRLFAVGGGKGGVGKSVVAGNLAVYLAQIGRRVVLVDADATGANLHLVLGAEEAAPTVAEVRDEELPLITTAVPGLRLLTASSDPAEGGALKTARKARLITQLRTIDADDIVIDVGPGTSASACDMFLV